MSTATVHPSEIPADGPADGILVDVRSPGEFNALHARGAVNLPLDGIDPSRLTEVAGEEPRRVYLLCQHGNRARMACEKLGDVAHDLVVVEGGTTAWLEAGRPVVRGRGTIAIERQVRIVAGLLVAVGTACGFWLHPAFLILPGFVGLGLAFAGITGFCGMGLLLAKMPWNARPRGGGPACEKAAT